MSADVELAVVGAGPAGLAAATRAAGLGVETVVLDEQPAPGGQIYRGVERNLRDRPEVAGVLGPDYAAGLAVVEGFRASGAGYEPETSVWEVSAQEGGRGVAIGVTRAGRARLLRARRVIVAAGAMERPAPVPGWTLPGVMGAGAAQTLLKGAGLAPEVPVAIVGCGPLVHLVAWQLARAGAPLAAVWLTDRPRGRLDALPALPRALLGAAEIARGLGWLREVRRRGIPVQSGARDVRIEGRDRAEAVSAEIGGRRRRLEVGLVLQHEGVVPNASLAQAAGCEHVWDRWQRCWRPVLDAFGASTVEGVAVAGDAAGIGGAAAALERGRLAALDAAYRLGRMREPERDALAVPVRAALRRGLRLRPFLDRLFRPADGQVLPADGRVTVCRCEGVRAADLERVIALGCPGPNQGKAYLRCGMGPCQGRMCGLTVTEIFAAGRGVSPAEVGRYRLRPPVKPLTVGELAALDGVGEPPAGGGGLPVAPATEGAAAGKR